MEFTNNYHFPKPTYGESGADKAEDFSDAMDQADTSIKTEITAHTANVSNPHAVTKNQVGLSDVTNDAQLTRDASDFYTFTEKATPANADLVLIEDSADGYVKKKVQVGNLPGGEGGGVETFVELTDVPASYTGAGYKVVRVNAAATGLEFNAPDYIVTGTAGENLSGYEPCYLKSDGKYWKAKADAVTTMPVLVMPLAAINADATGLFLRRGRVINGSWSFATIGGLIYASPATAGVLTQTLPSASGNQVQILGLALSATSLDFDPNLSLVEIL